MVSREYGNILYGGFPKFGVPFLGSHNKDYNDLGPKLGSPHFGKLPYRDCIGIIYGLYPIFPSKRQ